MSSGGATAAARLPRLCGIAAALLFGGLVVLGCLQSLRVSGTPPRVSLEFGWYLGALEERGDSAALEGELAMASNVMRATRHRSLAKLGRLLARRGELAGAEAALRESLAFQPRYLGARLELASVLTEQRRFEEALAELAVVLHQRPGHRLATENQEILRDFVARRAQGR